MTMRVSVAERARLSVLIGRRAFHSVVGGINAHPLFRWRFASTKTDRLLIAPQDFAPPTQPAPARSTPAVSLLPAKW